MKLLFLFISLSLSPLAFSRLATRSFVISSIFLSEGCWCSCWCYYSPRQPPTLDDTTHDRRRERKEMRSLSFVQIHIFLFSVDFCTHFINYCHCYDSRPYITCECNSNIPKMWDLAIHRFPSQILSSFNLFSFLEIKIKTESSMNQLNKFSSWIDLMQLVIYD